jgi:hypothetical protein
MIPHFDGSITVVAYSVVNRTEVLAVRWLKL